MNRQKRTITWSCIYACLTELGLTYEVEIENCLKWAFGDDYKNIRIPELYKAYNEKHNIEPKLTEFHSILQMIFFIWDEYEQHEQNTDDN